MQNERVEKHKDVLIPVWLPTASPEFMVLEECWNILKNEYLLVSKYYQSFIEFRNKITEISEQNISIWR